MRVGLARAAAIQWVARHAQREAGFQGAYFSGSTTWLTDDDELPPASDVDIVVVVREEPPLKLGKFRYQGVLLEITYLDWARLATAEHVLASYHLAGGFRVDTIIADPTGRLRTLHARVSREFARPIWVRRRCADARQRIENGLATLDASAPLHDRVLAWLFPTGVTTHVLLVAALRNPTVRLRYPAARQILIDYGHANRYPALLELMGCARLSRQRVTRHLRELARTFDATAAVARTPLFFSSDITAEARPIAIDGSQELIDRGLHREAVFWIIATFARCHKILAVDGTPELRREHAPAFEAAVADLGVGSSEELRRRAGEVIGFLPDLWDTAEAILSANTAITYE